MPWSSPKRKQGKKRATPSFANGLMSELKLAVPWGHIAAKIWGPQQGSPVLCLHGWLDNANSFDRLIPLLPKALKWNRFSLLGHSFGGTVGGMFSCIFPEMVDKLILLDSSPFVLDTNEVENMLSYKRRAIEHTLQVEASNKPSRVVSPQEMLQGLLKNNSHVGEECGALLLQRGTTPVAAGLVMNRDRRISWPEQSFEFISRELFVHAIKQLQARVLLIKAMQGFYNVRREHDADKEPMQFVTSMLRSLLREVGARGLGRLGRPEPSPPLLFSCTGTPGLAPGLTGGFAPCCGPWSRMYIRTESRCSIGRISRFYCPHISPGPRPSQQFQFPRVPSGNR
ncbi:serine hydrolase-like protein 2 isoform X4 [Phacochoerus africanus]|uniref:serine hydrolase-like protein 2 isoform X4 n=1 Tax=Phacochoerus africanus TaxID=41426 RepID=UPI001FD8BE3C|nr:serine hydrolase-like protein 2 isoform X4 [Phacochoerus africanus]